ncbi:Hypothetical predicted protein [Pelobates cultripes]|uniref:Uncharacterized protein n=1 Tax=Pelobates cultripes TaxID=61616 RepID=A0AAD1WGW2_PELCU|nr:Hypothetical predicted protein [Pelobates cultripes]
MADTMCAGGKGKTSSLHALTITIAAPAFRPYHTGKQDNSRLPLKPSKPATTAAAPRGWRYTEHQHSRLEGPSLLPSEKPQHTTRPLTSIQLALRQHRNRHTRAAVTKPSTMAVPDEQKRQAQQATAETQEIPASNPMHNMEGLCPDACSDEHSLPATQKQSRYRVVAGLPLSVRSWDHHDGSPLHWAD